ncbi:hypothetical protein HMPREF2898_03790 [Atopobium sp. HMSC064B08]|nr:hypothetical protein HMPREF2898_03790 [Atopobium sp. HMSC064B08]
MPGKLTEGVDEETKPKGEITQDPKPDVQPQDRLITSQNDTAPKHSRQRYYGPSREALEAGGGPPRRDSREPTAAEDGGLRGTVANLHTDSDLTSGSYAGDANWAFVRLG